MESYLKNLFQNLTQYLNIGFSYNSWNSLIKDVSQDSILGSSLFKKYIKDAFAFIQKYTIFSFADNFSSHS